MKYNRKIEQARWEALAAALGPEACRPLGSGHVRGGRKPALYSVEMGQWVHRNWEHNREQARWEALAAERDCTVLALVEWYCREMARELDADEDAPLH
jgi:hypothetical protein